MRPSSAVLFAGLAVSVVILGTRAPPGLAPGAPDTASASPASRAEEAGQTSSEDPRRSLARPLQPVLPGTGASAEQEMRALLRSFDEARSADLVGLRQVALHSEDPLAAGNALRALGRLDAAAVHDEALALLDDVRSRVRQEAIVVLGRSGRAESIPALGRMLEDEDPTQRALAIQALGRLGGEQARGLLERLQRTATLTRSDEAFLRSAIGQLERQGKPRPLPIPVAERLATPPPGT